MSAPFRLTPEAIQDPDNIWWFIADQNKEAADRVEAEIVATCRRLAEYPLIGHPRRDITPQAVRFWTLRKYPNYVIIYRPETKPLQVVAILQGKRDIKAILNAREVGNL